MIQFARVIPLVAFAGLSFRLVGCSSTDTTSSAGAGPGGKVATTGGGNWTTTAGGAVGKGGTTTSGGYPTTTAGGIAGKGAMTTAGGFGSPTTTAGGVSSGGEAGNAAGGVGATGGASGSLSCANDIDCEHVCIGDNKVHDPGAKCDAGGHCVFTPFAPQPVVAPCWGGCSGGQCLGQSGIEYRSHGCSGQPCGDESECSSGVLSKSGGVCTEGLCVWSKVSVTPCSCPAPYCLQNFSKAFCSPVMQTAGGAPACSTTAGGATTTTGGGTTTGGNGGVPGNGGGAGAPPQSCTDVSQCSLPASSCNGNDLVFWTTPDCVAGTCSFSQHTVPCAGMCMGGQCVPM